MHCVWRSEFLGVGHGAILAVMDENPYRAPEAAPIIMALIMAGVCARGVGRRVGSVVVARHCGEAV